MGKDLRIQIIGDARSFRSALGDATKAGNTFSSRASKWGKVVAVGLGGVAVGAGIMAKGFANAAIDAEASQAKVKKMLENVGVSWEKHGEQIDKTIQKHAMLTGFDDEELEESFANMVRTTGNVNKAFELNALAADIARTKGVELAGAQSLLARVYNGSFMGVKRLGISIEKITTAQDALKNSTTKATDEQVKAAKAQDAIATRNAAIAKLQEQLGGQAEAYGKTTAGAVDRAKVAWENLQEEIGARLTPTLTRLLDWFVANMPTIEKVFNAVGDAVAATAQAIGASVEWLRGQWETHRETAIRSWEAVRDAVMGVVDWFKTNVVPPIKAVVDLIKGYWDRFGDAILSNLRTAFSVAITVIKTFVQNAIAPFKIFAALLRGDWGAAWDELKGVVTRSLNAVQAILSGSVQILMTSAKAIGKAIYDGALDVLRGIGSKFKAIFIDPIVSAIRGAAQRVGEVALKVVLAIVEPFTHLPSFLGAPFREAKEKMLGLLANIGTEGGKEAKASGEDIGYWMAFGLKAGIAANVAVAVNAALEAGRKVAAAFAQAAETKSPSKATTQVGRDLMGGLDKGIKEGTPASQEAAAKATRDVIARQKAEAAYAKEVGAELARMAAAGLNQATPTYAQQLRAEGARIVAEIAEGIKTAQANLSSAFESLANAALAAFDKSVEGWKPPALKMLEKMRLEDEIAAVKGRVQTAKAELDALMAESAAASQKRQGLGLEPPPGMDPEEWEKAVAETEAIIKENGPKILAAQEEVAAAERAKLEFDLEQKAIKQQEAHDKGMAKKRARLQDELAQIEADLKAQRITWDEGQARIVKLLDKYGVDYEKAGKKLGREFADGLRKGMNEVGSAVEELAEAIARRLKGKSPPPEGPLRDIDKWGMILAKTFADSFRRGWKREDLSKIIGEDFLGLKRREGLPTGEGGITFGGNDSGGGGIGGAMKPEWADQEIWDAAVGMAMKGGQLDELIANLAPYGSIATNARLLDLMHQNRGRFNWGPGSGRVKRLLDLMGPPEWLSGSEVAAMFGLREGGIVTGPTTALIGEAGPEAVIPLDRLIGPFARAGRDPIEVAVYLDGERVGRRLAQPIESEFERKRRRTGSLAFQS